MRLGLLSARCGLTLLGPERDLPLMIRVDSRDVSAGDGFVALRGEHVDGRRFIPDVLAKGASLVVCEKAAYLPEWNARFPQVSFLLTEGRCEYGLALLASEYLKTLAQLKEFIAVTGSVGKTSTKNYARAFLEERFKLHCAGGNYNTLIGCAVTMLAAPSDTEVLLFEMGANHKGEIAEMARFMPPTIAAITEVTPVHVEGFGSLEGVLAAKSEILSSSALRLAVINGDNAMLCHAVDSMKLPSVLRFGRTGGVAFERERLSWTDGHFQVDAVLTGLDGISFNLSLPLSGIHQLYPLCCACAISESLGLSTREIALSVAKCRSGAGRGEIRQALGGAAIVDECYNASPAAMKASLASMNAVEIEGRRFLILGEMRELGPAAKEEHEKLLRRALSVGGELFLYGGEWDSVEGAAPYCFGSLEELVSAVEALKPGKGDVILVKGSRGNHLEQVVKALEL